MSKIWSLGAGVQLTAAVLSLAACNGVSDLDRAAEVQLAIAITSVLSEATGQPVDPQNVSGTIRIGMTVTLPPDGTATVRASLGSTSVCSSEVTSPSGLLALSRLGASSGRDVQMIECQVNTSMFNEITGAPAFPNGPRTLTAEVFYRPRGAAAGTQAQQAAISQQLTLSNQSGFFANVTNTPTTAQAAVDADGQSTHNGVLYRAGSINVQLVPVIFSSAPSDRVVTFTVTLTDANMIARGTDNTTTDGFRVTFPADQLPPNGVADVSSTDIRINVSSTTAGGAAGPGGVVPTTYAIDNRAPDGGPLRFVGFLNGAFNFNQVLTPNFTLNPEFFPSPQASNPDFGGVNRVTAAFFATGPSGSEVRGSRPQDFPQGVNRFAVVLTDALGNARKTIAANTTVVDYTAPVGFGLATGPTILVDRAINPPAGSVFGVTSPTDAHSGVAGIRAVVIGQAPGGTTCLYGNANPATNACDPRQSGNTIIPYAPITGSYSTGIATAVDQAGNETDPVTVTVLNDLTPPTASQIHATTGGPLGGGPLNVQISATDDIDLSEVNVSQCFDFLGVLGCLPVIPTVSLGSWGPSTFTTSASREVTIPRIIKSVERTLTSGAPEGVAHPAVGVLSRVMNQARLIANGTTPFAPGLFASPGPSFATQAAPRLQISTGAARVGNGAAGAPPCPAGVSTSMPIRFSVTGTAPFANPFQSVTLYFTDQGASRVITVDVPLTPTTTGGFVEHATVYAWAPTGVPAQTTNVSGYGITSNGAAWLSRSTPVTIENCS